MRRRDGTSAQDTSVRAFYEQVGVLLKSARQSAGLTQEQLADGLGLTRASVANLEAGRQRVPVHTLLAAADVVGVELTTLLPSMRQQAMEPQLRGVTRSTPGSHVEMLRNLIHTAEPDREGS